MPLFWLSLSYLLGIFLASIFDLPVSIWLGIALFTGVTGFLVQRYLAGHFHFRLIERIKDHNLWQRFRLNLPAYALLTALALGAAWYAFRLPDITEPDFIANYISEDTTWVLRGTVVEFPDDLDTYQRLVVETAQIRTIDTIQHLSVHGRLLVRTSAHDEFQYGDEIVLEGRLLPNAGDTGSSYQRYLERQGIYASMSYPQVGVLSTRQGNPLYALLMRYRRFVLGLAEDYWPQPESALLSGILLGIETAIPDAVYEAFQNTGTSHIIAISGFNITLIAGLFAGLSGRVFNPRRALLISIGGITVYTLLVGADAAVVRAAIMGGLALFGRHIGRKNSGVNTLAVTAAVMALVDPHVLWDIGFQLSFAATLGLVLYADPLAQWFIDFSGRWLDEDQAERLAGPAGEYLLFTLAANITTLPLILLYSQGTSLLSPLVNLLILPVQPAIMILGGVAVIAGSILPVAGQLLAYLAWPFAFYTIRIVEWMDNASLGMIHTGEISPWWIVLVYALIVAATFFSPEVNRWRQNQQGIGQQAFSPLAVGLLTITLIAWHTAQRVPDRRLHLTFLDSGTANAVLVQTPTGRYVLLNGGESAVQLANQLGRRLPLNHRRLDYLVVASPGANEIGALEDIIDQYPPANVLWSGLPSPNREADYLRQGIIERGIPLVEAETGHAMELGDGARLEVLSTSTLGGIYLLEWGNFRAILPFGADPEELLALSQTDKFHQPAFVLAVEHGYAPANPPGWVDNLRPQFIVLTVAAGDPDGLPDKEFVEAAEDYTLLRTDRHGWIEISTNGQQMWVSTENLFP